VNIEEGWKRHIYNVKDKNKEAEYMTLIQDIYIDKTTT
jgi:hypothetical protein